MSVHERHTLVGVVRLYLGQPGQKLRSRLLVMRTDLDTPHQVRKGRIAQEQ